MNGKREYVLLPILLIFFSCQQLKGPIVSRLRTIILLIKAKRKNSGLRSSALRIWKGKGQNRIDGLKGDRGLILYLYTKFDVCEHALMIL